MKQRMVFAFLGAGQLLAGGLAFLTWGTVSGVLSQESFAASQTGLTWGTTLYMPLSMGLPFLLANWARSEGRADRERFLFAVRAASVSAMGACGFGLTLAFFGARFTVLSAVLGVGGTLCVAMVAQQIGRIRLSVIWFAAGAIGNLVFPVCLLLSGPPRAGFVLDPGATVLLNGIGIAGSGAVLLFAHSQGSSSTTTSPARSALVRALPLVPHLLLFGILSQGVRFASVVSGAPSSELVQAGYLTQFMGIGFAGVASVHGLLAATVQKTDDQSFRVGRQRFAAYYAWVGFIASTGVVVALVSPLVSLFQGFERLPLTDLALVAAVLGSLSGYYFQSTVLVRQGATKSLVAISGPVVGLYLLFTLFVTGGLTILLSLFAATMVMMHVVCMIVVSARSRPTEGYRKPIGLVTFGAYLPALALGAAASIVAVAP